MKNNKIIIAFTRKTSKILPKIFCKRFRHCAVIFPNGNNYIFIQIAVNGVRLIMLDKNGLSHLEKDDWVLVHTKITKPKRKIYFQMLTCVGFAKRTLSIRNPFIWTPDALYKKVNSGK